MSGEGTEQTLASRLVQARREGRDDVHTAIRELTGIATRLDMKETSKRLDEIQLRLDSDTFNLMVMGRFNTGKSTLLNALLGGTTKPVDLGGRNGPMAVDDHCRLWRSLPIADHRAYPRQIGGSARASQKQD